MVAALRGQLAGRDDGDALERSKVEALLLASEPESAHPISRVAADVLTDEDGLGPALPGQPHHFSDDVAASDEEGRVAVAKRAVEVAQAFEQEGKPVGSSRTAGDQPSVDDECRNDSIGSPSRCRQRGMVVQPQVAGEEDDRGLHCGQASGEPEPGCMPGCDSEALGSRADSAIRGWKVASGRRNPCASTPATLPTPQARRLRGQPSGCCRCRREQCSSS
jgi:hypothetical protein